MNGLAVSQADDPQEQWNRVHAQLLKSVADAQARLLAGINEVSDRLPSKLFAELASVDQALLDIRARVEAITGRLDAIGAVLAELLQPKSSATLRKSYRTQPKSKRKRHG